MTYCKKRGRPASSYQGEVGVLWRGPVRAVGGLGGVNSDAGPARRPCACGELGTSAYGLGFAAGLRDGAGHLGVAACEDALGAGNCAGGGGFRGVHGVGRRSNINSGEVAPSRPGFLFLSPEMGLAPKRYLYLDLGPWRSWTAALPRMYSLQLKCAPLYHHCAVPARLATFPASPRNLIDRSGRRTRTTMLHTMGPTQLFTSKPSCCSRRAQRGGAVRCQAQDPLLLRVARGEGEQTKRKGERGCSFAGHCRTALLVELHICDP